MKSQKYKASVLAVSLIIMGVMLIIALGISFSALQSRKASIGSSKSNVAFQNADSGVEKIMYDIVKVRSASDLVTAIAPSTGTTCNAQGLLVGSSFNVELRDVGTPAQKINCFDNTKFISDIATIKSTGYSSQDSRAIEVDINP